MEEENAAPSADAGLSLDAAVERFGNDAPQERQEAPQEQGKPAEESGRAEPEAPQEQAQSEPEAIEVLHGNARTRLRDGTEISIADLKKAYGEQKDFTRRQSEFETQRRSFEENQTKAQQQEAFFQNSIQQAMAVLQARAPQRPDIAMRDSDPLEYYRQLDDFNRAVGEYQQLANAQQEHARKTQAEHEKRWKDLHAKEREALVERLPELKSEEGLKAFRSDVVKHSAEYGFTTAELDTVIDHRMYLVLKDAISWRKLQANKPVAMEKSKDAPPVQSPAARRTGAERSAQSREEGFERLRKSGSIDDALALLNNS